MENKEVYQIERGVKEVVITHKNALDEQKPLQVNIAGNIDSVARWLEKRIPKGAESWFPHSVDFVDSHVIINREELKITLIFNENDPLNFGKVAGVLKFNPDLLKWKINTGEELDHKSLSEFIKMNRSCFLSKSDAMKLSADLANLKVKVDKEFEKSSDNRGSVKHLFAQSVIEMNIPKTFKLSVPVFKGMPKSTFEVEIYVNPNNYMVSLISPEANDIVSDLSNDTINEQKNLIKEILPELVIIEQ